MSASAGNVLGTAILKLGADRSGLTQDLGAAQQQVQGFGERASQAAGKLATFGLAAQGIQAVGGALGSVANTFKSFVSQASESQQIMAQTVAVIKSTGGAAGLTANDVADLSTALSKVNPIDDEVIQSTENLLLTFTSIGKDIFPQVTQTALDMSVALKEDTKEAAIQLGKALQDPIQGVTALRRVGVNFNQSQQDVIKNLVETGQTAKAQGLILTELNREFGGSGAAAAKTYAGQMEILRTQIGNVAESLGGAILPELTSFASFVTNTIVPKVQALADAFNNAPESLKKSIAVIGGLTVAFTGLVPVVGGLAIAFGLIGGPVTLVIGIIAALAAGVALLVVNWGSISAKFPEAQVALDAAKQAFSDLWDIIKQGAPFALGLVKGFAEGLLGEINIILAGLVGFGKVLHDVFTLNFKAIGGDVKDAIDGVKKGLDDLKKGALDIVEPFTQDAKAADRVSEAADHMGGAAEEMKNKLFSTASAAQQSADALHSWADAQKLVDTATSNAGSAIDLWTQKQQDAQKAIDDLNETKKRNGKLTEEEQQQYDTLTHFVKRLGAGIQDDLQPQYIAAQVAAAKFQEQQDSLAQQLKDGKITQEQYNQAVDDANKKAQEALDPNQRLIESNQALVDVIGKISDSIHDMLVALGAIPPETPAHVTDDGTIDAQKQKFLELNGVIVDTPTEWTTTAKAETTEANQNFKTLEQNITDFPGTFSITANVDIGPALDSIGKLGRAIPHSPAEEGPLSKEPNWDWLFAGLEAAAGKRTDDALAHLKNFADTASQITQTMQQELDFSKAAADFQASGGKLPGLGFVDKLRDFAASAVKEAGDVAGDFSQEFTDRVGRISTTVRNSFDALGAALDFAGKAQSIDPRMLGKVTSDLLGKLKLIGEQAVVQLAQVSAVYDDGVFVGAQHVAGVISDTLGAFTDILTFVQKFAAFDQSTTQLPSFAMLGDLKLVGEQAILKLDELAKAYGPDFGQAIGPATQAIQSAVDAFSKLFDFIQHISSQNFNDLVLPPNWFVGSAKALAEQMILKLNEMTAAWGPDLLAATQPAADAVNAAIGAFASLFDFLQKISGQNFNAIVTPPDWFLPAAISLARQMVAMLGTLANEFGATGSSDDNTVLGASKTAADAVQAATGTFNDLLGFVKNIVDLGALAGKDIPDATLANLGSLARRLTDAFLTAASGLDTDTLSAAKDYADALDAPFKVFEDTLSFIKDAAGFNGTLASLAVSDQFVQNLTGVVAKITSAFKAAADAVGTDGLDNAKALADTLGPMLAVLKPLQDGITAIVSSAVIPDRALDTFKGNVTKLLDLVSELRKDADAHLEDALSFQKTMEAIAAALQAAANSFATINGTNPATSVSAPDLSSGSIPAPPDVALNVSGRGASTAQPAAQQPAPTHLEFSPTFHMTIAGEQFKDLILRIVSENAGSIF